MLWVIILVFDYGVRAIENVDLTNTTFLYGYQPSLDALMFFRGDGFGRHGFGIASVADLWIGAFPLSMLLVYAILQAKAQAEEGFYARLTEVKSLIKNDSLQLHASVKHFG